MDKQILEKYFNIKLISYEDMRTKYVRSHKECGGHGIIKSTSKSGVEFENCICTWELKRQLNYQRAGIPLRYRSFSLKSLNAKFQKANAKSLLTIYKYVDDLQLHEPIIGPGLLFQSQSGLAKTSIVSWTLRQALDARYNGFFARCYNLVRLAWDALRDKEAATALSEICKSDILVIDEIENIYAPDASMAETIVASLFGNLYDGNVSILATTNLNREQLLSDNQFTAATADKLEELKDVIFTGKSWRKNRKHVSA